jgi:hypothetical protein
MESMLSGFQADLGNISEEIKYLQEQSSSMSVKLRNRKVWAWRPPAVQSYMWRYHSYE